MIGRKIFISTTGTGLARAELSGDDEWAIEKLLSDIQVNCLANDPFQAGVVYAGTLGGGILRSDERGITWRNGGLRGSDVRALAASPHDRGTLFAGTRPAALHVSNDGGESWREIESFQRIPWKRLWLSPTGSPFTAYPLGIAISPTDPYVIVVGIEFGAVVRSADGGKAWSGHRKGSLRDCHSLIAHASDGNWFYEAGGTGGGAAFSKDGGITWHKHNAGLDRSYGWACAADPGDPSIWYVSVAPQPTLFNPSTPPAHIDGEAQAYIFRSEAGGPFRKLGGGLPQPLDYMAYELVSDPGAPGTLYAGLSNGDVWHTEDYGENWFRLPFNLDRIERSLLIISPLLCLNQIKGEQITRNELLFSLVRKSTYSC